MPVEPPMIRAKLSDVGAACKAEVGGSDPFRQPWGINTGDRETRGSSRRGSAYGHRALSRSAFAPGSVPRPLPTNPAAKRAHRRQPSDRPFPYSQVRAHQGAKRTTARAALGRPHSPTFDELHTPQLHGVRGRVRVPRIALCRAPMGRLHLQGSRPENHVVPSRTFFRRLGLIEILGG